MDRTTYDAQIKNWFMYHPPTEEQRVAYEELRAGAKALAYLINTHVPDGADKSAAFRLLRETLMTANAGIACATNTQS